MKDFFEGVYFVVGFILCICIVFYGIWFVFARNDCKNLAKIYETKTLFYATSGCYIKDNGKYISSSLFEKSRLVTDKGLTINKRIIEEKND